MSHYSDIMLAGVSRDARIIEIGPSFNPVAPKSAGWNSATLDHTTREGLLAKYAGRPGIDVDAIEPVDFVWTTGSLCDAVPPAEHDSFDVLLASHVIEHTPDLIAFLDAAEALLKQDGTVILAVPDKRFCFDFFQPVTTTGQVLEAHASRRVRHHRERAFDHYAYAVADGKLEAWGQRPSQGLWLLNGVEDAAEKARVYEMSEGYHDLHAWHFVPSSFELLLLELGRLGRTDWSVERIACPGGWEFFAWLRRGARAHHASASAEALQVQRMALLKRVLLESQSQIDWLLDSDPGQVDVAALPVTSWTAKHHLALAELKLSELRGKFAEADARHARTLARVAALENSTFWRASAPIRKVLDRMKRRGSSNAGAPE